MTGEIVNTFSEHGGSVHISWFSKIVRVTVKTASKGMEGLIVKL